MPIVTNGPKAAWLQMMTWVRVRKSRVSYAGIASPSISVIIFGLNHNIISTVTYTRDS